MASTRNTNRQHILTLMQELEKKTRTLIPFSTNLLSGSPPKKEVLLLFGRHKQTHATKKYYELDIFSEITKKIGEDRKTALKIISNQIKRLPYREHSLHRKNYRLKNRDEIMENIAKHSIKHRVGNCGELVNLLILMLRELGPQPNLTIHYEAISLEGRADHEFIVINRDPNSDVRNLNSWGNDAIICDPWFRETVIVGEQLSLHPHFQANIITYLLAYRDEPYKIDFSGQVDNRPAHSHHWYEKYGDDPKTLFINQPSKNLEEVEIAEAEDKQPSTLMLAIKQGHIDVVAALLNYGVDANPPGAITPLSYVISINKKDINTRTKITELLLKAGATPHQTTVNGEPLLSYAIQRKLTGIEALLREAEYQHPSQPMPHKS